MSEANRARVAESTDQSSEAVLPNAGYLPGLAQSWSNADHRCRYDNPDLPIGPCDMHQRAMCRELHCGKTVDLMASSVPVAQPHPFDADPARSAVLEARHLSHRYDGAKGYALWNVSLRVEAGRILVVLGPVGSGKSTLARLLVEGRVQAPGVLRLRRSEERRGFGGRARVGYLPEDPAFHEGTVAQNIALSLDPDMAEVHRAAQLAHWDEAIMSLPDGYRTRLTQGGRNLSRGQRQGIALCRAWYGSPDVLILDEPDLHLDAEAERALALSLHCARRKGCAVVLITHNASTARCGDDVMVLRHGETVLSGDRLSVMRALSGRPGLSLAKTGR